MIKRNKLIKKYVCKTCHLVFLSDELKIRFVTEKKKCIRCLLQEQAKEGKIKLPECYGKSFNSNLDVCSRICTVREGCLINFVDDKFSVLDIDKKTTGMISMAADREGGLSQIQLAIRVLRIACRPMHIKDFLPIIEKLSLGRSDENKSSVAFSIRQSFLYCRDIVSLGNNTFMWVGIWRPEMGGKVGFKHQNTSKSSSTKPLKELLKDVKKREKNKG